MIEINQYPKYEPMGNAINEVGNRYNRLLVLYATKYKNKVHWVCKCNCGNIARVYGSKLRRGDTVSCGCYIREKVKIGLNYKHGLRDHPLYGTWVNIKTRCYNKNTHNFNSYGERGIKVCKDWLDDFMNFYNWSMENGYEEGLSIERVNVNGNYEPSNCKWIPLEDQVLNKRNVKLIKYKDKELSAQRWSLLLGWSKNTVRNRLNKGLPLHEVLVYKGGDSY